MARGRRNRKPRSPRDTRDHPSSHSKSGYSQGPKQHVFSMKDEAFLTGRHGAYGTFAPGRLRDKPVDFVSAGLLEGTLDKPSFPPPTTAMDNMTIRSSPTPSDSSEEKVVFKGRFPADPVQTPASVVSPPLPEAKVSAPERDGGGDAPAEHDVEVASSPSASGSSSDENQVIPDVFEERLKGKSRWETNTTPWVSRSMPGIGWLPGRHALQYEDINALDDYMQNIQEYESDGEANTPAPSTLGSRPLDVHLNRADDWVSEVDEPPHMKPTRKIEPPKVFDFDDLSTSFDIIDKVEKVLGKRKRPHGVQYLVSFQNHADDNPQWLPAELLDDSNDLELIAEFEARKAAVDDVDSDNGMSEDYEASEDGSLPEDESIRCDYDDPVEPDTFEVGTRRSSNRHTAPPVTSRFPSASLMADVLEADPYNGFDIMDYDRPSLRAKNKGRRGRAPPELSDPDLNDQLQEAWENDRKKKRIKKAEREELRKQGLLGRKGKSTAALAVKYKDGFSMVDIVEEIRSFMMSDVITCSLPPMDVRRRATIHQFAHRLGLGSKSRGGGQERFTVLSKTLRTVSYDEDVFDSITSEKRFRSRLRTQGPSKGRGPPGPRPIVSYKDGETVGGLAPELGPENIGRAMLEKMGWSKGTALGADHNKGILTPLTHTMKKNKAGLQ